MVIFRDAEGKPGYHQAEALEDAVAFVEELRNEREVTDTRVFSMQEVPIEFKTYWRVEVMAPAAATVLDPVPEPAPEPFAPAPPAVAVAVAEEPVAEFKPTPFPPPDPQPAHNRFGLFSRS